MKTSYIQNEYEFIEKVGLSLIRTTKPYLIKKRIENDISYITYIKNKFNDSIEELNSKPDLWASQRSWIITIILNLWDDLLIEKLFPTAKEVYINVIGSDLKRTVNGKELKPDLNEIFNNLDEFKNNIEIHPFYYTYWDNVFTDIRLSLDNETLYIFENWKKEKSKLGDEYAWNGSETNKNKERTEMLNRGGLSLDNQEGVELEHQDFELEIQKDLAGDMRLYEDQDVEEWANDPDNPPSQY